MPIRFACPHCRQKLTVSTRKAGSAADCPRCKHPITVPEPPPEPSVPPPAEKLVLGPAAAPASPVPTANQESPTSPEPPPTAAPAESTASPAGPGTPESLPAPPPASPSPPGLPSDVAMPLVTDSQGFEGLELVYDTTEPDRDQGRPAERDLVAVPRYVLYLQGGLLAVVAVAAFGFGMLAGRTMQDPAAQAVPQPSVIRGRVTFTSGAARQPDEGAVVIVIPKKANHTDDKGSIEGLRPGDPTPDESHRGLAILQELGGGYARADGNGRFTIRVPDAGQYLVLVLSREKRSSSADDIRTADILSLAPYFEDASDLVAQHRYQLTTESVRGERQLDVVFQ